ncbi:MAG: glycosyltransferase family 2 protein [Ferruginibacter sp.]
MSNKDYVLVSVLMTAYNREQYISESIESVLASSYKNFELIIVDDKSTDNTYVVAEKFANRDDRIRLYKNEINLGDYPNRNKAASYAKGKYIKYVDSDDSILPEGLKIMVNSMENYPEAAFGFCDIKKIEVRSYPYLLSGKEALRKHFLNKGLLLAGPASAIIKLKSFYEIGGFSETRYVSDYEAWLKLCLNNALLILEPDLVNIRIHPGQEMDVGKLAYYHLNYDLHKQFLNLPEAPFTNLEKKKLLFNYKVLLGRRVYQRLIKWYGIKKSLETIKKAGETPFILISAFFPMKKFNN